VGECVVAWRKLVFGIGNPGFRYRKTRHNVGFMVIDAVAREMRIGVKRRVGDSVVGEGRMEGGGRLILAKPVTYVNLCGRAYEGLMREYDLLLEDELVVCDDISLPVGRIRLRRKGSSGGHKGLESIASELGTEEFPRLRVGIGGARGDQVDFVLSGFGRGERETITRAIERSAEAVKVWAEQGIDEAMNVYNKKEEETKD